MGVLDVNSTPQPIYPDGLQEPFVIYNRGPYKIYADQDGTVDTDSLMIPPLGTLVWDYQRPLWLKCVDPIGSGNDPSKVVNPTSKVAITRNSNTTQFVTSNTFVRIATLQATVSFNGSIYLPYIDVSSYAAIQIRISSDTYQQATGAFDATKGFGVEVAWLSSQLDKFGNLTAVGVDQVTAMAPGPSTAGTAGGTAPGSEYGRSTRITLPTRGEYMTAIIDNLLTAGPTTYQVTIDVYGSTIALPDTVSFMPADDPYFYSVTPTSLVNGSDGFSFNWAANAFSSFIIPGKAPRVRLTYRTAESVATAGTITVRSSLISANIAHGPDIAIPVASAGDFKDVEFAVPINMPTTIACSVIPKNSGGANLSFLYLKIQYLF